MFAEDPVVKIVSWVFLIRKFSFQQFLNENFFIKKHFIENTKELLTMRQSHQLAKKNFNERKRTSNNFIQ